MNQQLTDNPIEIVSFTPEHLPAIRRFSELIWPRPRTEDYFQWRYLDCPTQFGLLAMQRNECLAMIWCFLRKYSIDKEQHTVREILDWYCRPDLRGSGLGIRVMHALMQSTDPLINVGGSSDTLGLLPRLGWSRTKPMKQYLLPLAGSALTAYVKKKLPVQSWLINIPCSGLAWGLRLTSRQFSYPTGRCSPMTHVSDEILALYNDLGSVTPLPSIPFLQWLLNCPPAMGRYLPLYFYEGEKLCGWSWVRLYTTPAGREARILEVFSNKPSPTIYAWILSETLQTIQSYNPEIIFAGACDPFLQSAFKRNGFIGYTDIPVHYFAKDLIPDGASLNVQNNTSDFPLLPYPVS